MAEVDKPERTTAPLLEASGLRKAYPGVVAVDDVSLSVAPGEVIGLVGKNGAGKSSLIKILAGAVQPDAGTLTWQGAPLLLKGPHDATVSGLSFVHQELAVVPDLSVAENVELGLGYPRTRGVFIDRRRLRKRAEEVLTRLGSTIDPAAPMRVLSVADQRMVMIARALVSDARLVVMDEPTASLTQEEVGDLFRVIGDLSAHGVAVIYVSHRLEEIFATTRRVVVMRDGCVVADQPTDTFTPLSLIEQITGSNAGSTAQARRNSQLTPHNPEAPVVLDVRGLHVAGHVHPSDFQLREGEILGLAGLVGAGRTEMVRAMFGADRRTGGEIRIADQLTDISSPRDAIRAGLIMLPEDRRNQGILGNFSVGKNITIGTLPDFRVRGRVPVPSAANEHQAATAAIDSLQIATPSAATPAHHLSGGNQQKLVLARWLKSGARCFIFDEPTHGIDVGAKEEVYLLMERLASQGNGVIFISSEFGELVGVCHRVLVLREGQLVEELEGDEVTETRMLTACYASATD